MDGCRKMGGEAREAGGGGLVVAPASSHTVDYYFYSCLRFLKKIE